MIVHGEQVRLTPRERRVLKRITGIDPHFIRDREGLQRFRDQHLANRASDPAQIRLLKALLRRHLVP